MPPRAVETDKPSAIDHSLQNGSSEMSSTATTPQSASVLLRCQVCRSQPAIYQCPRCSWKSCSLNCCVSHKKSKNCSGKRDRTTFVPLGRMNDQTVRSDYFFLEDVLGQVQSGKRLMRQVGAGSGTGAEKKRFSKRPRMHAAEDNDSQDQPNDEPQHVLVELASSSCSVISPAGRIAALSSSSTTTTSEQTASQQSPHIIPHPKARCLYQQAASRGIRLLFMPAGMTRHKENRSYYYRNKNVIFWTVEWFLYAPRKDGGNTAPQRGTAQLIETTMLWGALRQHSVGLQEIAREEDATKDVSYSLLLKKLPSPASRPSFVTVSRTATLAEALADTTVFEYPTFYVVPTDRLPEFPRAIEELQTTSTPDGVVD